MPRSGDWLPTARLSVPTDLRRFFEQTMTALSRPTYRRAGLRAGIVHFGVGNFHRSYQAMYIDWLLKLGSAPEWAICGVGLLPGDVAMRDALVAQDFRYTLVERDADVIVGHVRSRRSSTTCTRPTIRRRSSSNRRPQRRTSSP
jgi:mannitol-1-phosphate/altronate dehydrogenase